MILNRILNPLIDLKKSKNKFFSSFQKYFLVISSIFCSIFFHNILLAENGVLYDKFNKEAPINTNKIKRQKFPEASYNRIYAMENLAPLPFKKFPFKPVYKGDISDETIVESKNIKDSALNQISSTFNLEEQKKKDRKRNKIEMLAFNEIKNKKFFDYFKSLKRTRNNSPNLKGLRYDFTKYLQNFQIISKR